MLLRMLLPSDSLDDLVGLPWIATQPMHLVNKETMNLQLNLRIECNLAARTLLSYLNHSQLHRFKFALSRFLELRFPLESVSRPTRESCPTRRNEFLPPSVKSGWSHLVFFTEIFETDFRVD